MEMQEVKEGWRDEGEWLNRIPLNEWISLFHLHENQRTMRWRLLNRKKTLSYLRNVWDEHIGKKTWTFEEEAVVASFSIILESHL